MIESEERTTEELASLLRGLAEASTLSALEPFLRQAADRLEAQERALAKQQAAGVGSTMDTPAAGKGAEQ